MFKLGKKSPRIDRRTLRMDDYLPANLPVPPLAVDWAHNTTSWGVMMNDSLGDCTIAGCGHAVQVWTVNRGGMVTIPDSGILQAYEQWDGYNPTDPSTDQGGICLDVLNKWRTSGLSGHTIAAYVTPQPQNSLHVKQSIQFFGGLYIGIQLPISAQTQLDAGQPWDIATPDGGVWGGHCVFVCAYDPEYLTCITWGQLQKMSWAFWNQYCDESYCVLSSDWLSRGGLNLAALQSDLQRITT